MGLETGTTIAQLSVTNPTSGDPVNQGDDHLRLIKSVLKSQFPGAAAGGFAIPITATEVEINYLSGVTSSVQAQINAATSAIPSGSRLLFLNPAPPSGWNLISTWIDHFLRVTTVGGGSGGSHDPKVMNVVPAHTHNITVNNTTIAAHTHGFTTSSDGAHNHQYNEPIGSGTYQGGAVPNQDADGVANTSTNGTHNHSGTTNSGGGNTHTHSASAANNASASNWQPRYVDAIPCEKV